MQQWTVWEREVAEGVFAYNHSEAGWVCGDRPKPIDPSFIAQVMSWPNAEWRKTFTYKDGIVIGVTND